jgi:hypothetical protein
MSYFAAIASIVMATLLAAFATWVCHRFVNVEHRRRHHDVGSVVFMQLGVVFGVLLGFVFSEVWTEYDEASKAINFEVGALHGAAILAATLPPDHARQVLSAEQAYIESVVNDEWPVMARQRTEFAKTDDLLKRLLQSVVVLRPGDSQGDVRKGAILSLLTDAHKQRETRIYQAANGIPPPLWSVLIGLTAMLALFVSLSAIENTATAFAVSASFTAGTTSILMLARLLDFPFEGALALPPTDFAHVAAKVSALLSGVGAA